MSFKFDALADTPRLLMEVPLRPVAGHRFQPTGFPDLGPATYELNDGTQMLLVESTQSMANRLETACWDETADDWQPPLQGLPYVKSTLPDGTVTNSVLEAHRLNSPYIVKSDEFQRIEEAIGFNKDQPFVRKRLITALMRFDPSCLLHGVFLEKVGGVVRLPRSLSAFIEAAHVTVAAAGGVKIDRVQPATGESTKYGKAAEGYGNVPYHRDEFTGDITAYFNLDLAQIRGYGLGESATNLLIGLALYKIQKFLREGLRLRTACDLEPVNSLHVKRPNGFQIPELDQLEPQLPQLIDAASEHFASPRVTEVQYKK